MMERCFSCAEIGNCTELYARKPPDYYGPYFPTFEHYNPPSSSNTISADGTVKVCAVCKIYLTSQWQNFEAYKMPESRRIYFTKRQHAASLPSFVPGNELFAPQHFESTSSSMNNKSSGSLTSSHHLYHIQQQQQLHQHLLNKSTDIQKQPVPNIGSTETVTFSGKSSLMSFGNKAGLIDLPSEKVNLCDNNSSSLLDIGFHGNGNIANINNNNNNNNHKNMVENYINCFVCGIPCLKWNAKTAYSCQILENKEYFPFFEKLDTPLSSIGLTNGATKVCIACEIDLVKQWDHYEKLSTDQMSRIYHITSDHTSQFSLNNPGRFITNSMSNSQLSCMLKLKNIVLKCSLCLNKIIDSYKVSWNQRATCLYIPHLKNFQFPNDGVMVDKLTEEAIICDVCHYFLSCETQTLNMTPYHLREYKLPKVGFLPSLYGSLNENNQFTNAIRKQPSLGSSLSAFLPTVDSHLTSNVQSKRSRTPNFKNRSRTPSQISDLARSNSICSNKNAVVISHNNLDPTIIVRPIIANCHICFQELRDPDMLKTLRVASTDEHGDQPFFPFLKSLRQNTMKNYEFPVCVSCYFNMLGQWRMFQNSAVPVFERKYNHNEFMCTQCQRLYAQKSDVRILHERLVCVHCSEKRISDASSSSASSSDKSGLLAINQEHDANTLSLYSMKTKTTVTVTPISNEYSVPSLASFNYAKTMKQYSRALLPTTSSTTMLSNNPIGHLVESFSHNSSMHPDMFYNSKNIFSKGVKRPAVATVAPNQRQSTHSHQYLLSDSNVPSSNDFSQLKLSDLANFPANYFGQNSTINNLLSNNFYANSNANSLTMPLLSAQSSFGGTPSTSVIDWKNSSFPHSDTIDAIGQQQPSSFSSPFVIDYNKARNSNALHNSWNPFINWPESTSLSLLQQQQYQQFLIDAALASSFSFQSMMPGLDSNNKSIDNINYHNINNNINISNVNNNKDTDIAMKIWMMSQYQNQNQLNPPDSSTKPNKASPYLTNSSDFIDEMASNYWQMMLSSQIGGSGRDENVVVPNVSVPNVMTTNNSSSNTNNVQPWMTNVGLNNYQYQMMQVLTAYQASIANNHQYSQGGTKPPSLSSWLNQYNYNDFFTKLCRLDGEPPDQTFQSQITGNDMVFKNPDFVKTTLSFDHDKISKTAMSFNHSVPLTGGNNHDHQKYHPQNSSNNTDRTKMYKQLHDEHSRSSNSKTRLEAGKSGKSSKHGDAKFRNKKDLKAGGLNQSTVLDLSQNKSPRKSTSWTSYAIESLTENHKNQTDSWNRNSSEFYTENRTSISLVDQQIETRTNFLMKILIKLNAQSLIEIIKSMPTVLKVSKSTVSTISSTSVCAVNMSKCVTIWHFHQFLKIANSIIIDLKHISSFCTRRKSLFMKNLGLQDSFKTKRKNDSNEMKFSIVNHINSSTSGKATKYELYWRRWILRNVKRRFSLKNKPHLLRSLMRPVLSGDIEVVRFCPAKNKHELENLRNIIKILIKYT